MRIINQYAFDVTANLIDLLLKEGFLIQARDYHGNVERIPDSSVANVAKVLDDDTGRLEVRRRSVRGWLILNECDCEYVIGDFSVNLQKIIEPVLALADWWQSSEVGPRDFPIRSQFFSSEKPSDGSDLQPKGQSGLNLYLLLQGVSKGLDTYDSMVVCAVTPEEAVKIHPYGDWKARHVWAHTPEQVTVRLIGPAANGGKAGEIICASFNAG